MRTITPWHERHMATNDTTMAAIHMEIEINELRRYVAELEAQLAAPVALECLSTVNTLGGFKGGFIGLHGRAPTEQEIWNAAVRSGIDRTKPAQVGRQPVHPYAFVPDWLGWMGIRLTDAQCDEISKWKVPTPQ